MNPIPRRSFLKNSLVTAAALGLPSRVPAQPGKPATGGSVAAGAFIVDTNVNTGWWPFRHMKYSATPDLVAKLRKHKIKRAWAGSYDALFQKNIDSVNTRLAEDCRVNGGGILVPFGTVNPAFPDWEEDLRRCHEVHKMPGIRLHPIYNGYTLESPEFKHLLDGAARRGLLVQIAIDMEDERKQHPLVNVPAVDVAPLPDILKQIPNVRVMLVNPFRHVRGAKLKAMVERTDVTFEFSNLDGLSSVERILPDAMPWKPYHPLGRILSGGANPTVPLERLLFGSNAPFMPLEQSLFKLIESPLTRAQIDALAFGNADRILVPA
ncbi:MAG: metal-dependent hydrolase [Verrucomicrobia bacterium]|nr:metal-dependent hydrolase [Verrucomicrobiota bacterium]